MPRAKAKAGGRKPPAPRNNSRTTRGSSSLSPIKSGPSKSEQTDSPFVIPDAEADEVQVGLDDNNNDNNVPLDLGLGETEFPADQDAMLQGFDPALLLGDLGDMTGFEGSQVHVPDGTDMQMDGSPDDDLMNELSMGLGIGQANGDGADVEMLDGTQTGEAPEAEVEEEDEDDGEEEDDEEEEDDDEEEDGEEEEEDGEEEDEEEVDDDGEEEEEDDEEEVGAMNFETDAAAAAAVEAEAEAEEDQDDDDEPQRDEWVDCPEELVFRYPAAVPDFSTLDEREQRFKTARFLPCQSEDCICEGLEPPTSSSPEVKQVSREELDSGDLDDLEVPDGVEEDVVEKWRSEEGWWRRCGRCGHGWEGEGEGHVFTADEAQGEKVRKGRVVGRIEELLQVRTRSPPCAARFSPRARLTLLP